MQRLKVQLVANGIYKDGEIHVVEAGYRVINLLTRSSESIEFGVLELDIFVFPVELLF